MKNITMAVSVCVDNEPKSLFGEYSCDLEKITHCLYEHICAWKFNTHGTVDVDKEEIFDSSAILNTKKIAMTINLLVDDDPVSDCEEYSCKIEDLAKELYEYVSEWEFDVYDTVSVVTVKVVDEEE